MANIASLSDDEFVKEALARRPRKAKRFSAGDLADLRALYEEVSRPMRARQKERDRLEAELAQAVDEAYGLTPAEVELLWDTAPPRMPGKRRA